MVDIFEVQVLSYLKCGELNLQPCKVVVKVKYITGPPQMVPTIIQNNFCYASILLGIPTGPVVKNLPANAGDSSSIPGPGRFHVPWSN